MQLSFCNSLFVTLLWKWMTKEGGNYCLVRFWDLLCPGVVTKKRALTHFLGPKTRRSCPQKPCKMRLERYDMDLLPANCLRFWICFQLKCVWIFLTACAFAVRNGEKRIGDQSFHAVMEKIVTVKYSRHAVESQ